MPLAVQVLQATVIVFHALAEDFRGPRHQKFFLSNYFCIRYLCIRKHDHILYRNIRPRSSSQESQIAQCSGRQATFTEVCVHNKKKKIIELSADCGLDENCKIGKSFLDYRNSKPALPVNKELLFDTPWLYTAESTEHYAYAAQHARKNMALD